MRLPCRRVEELLCNLGLLHCHLEVPRYFRALQSPCDDAQGAEGNLCDVADLRFQTACRLESPVFRQSSGR